MARPPSRSAEDKVRIVLAVLRGEVMIAEAARREGVSQTSIANWRDQFLDGGQQAVAAGGPAKPTSREHQLAAENEQLAAAWAKPTWSFACGAKGGALYRASTSSTRNAGRSG